MFTKNSKLISQKIYAVKTIKLFIDIILTIIQLIKKFKKPLWNMVLKINREIKNQVN